MFRCTCSCLSQEAEKLRLELHSTAGRRSELLGSEITTHYLAFFLLHCHKKSTRCIEFMDNTSSVTTRKYWNTCSHPPRLHPYHWHEPGLGRERNRIKKNPKNVQKTFEENISVRCVRLFWISLHRLVGPIQPPMHPVMTSNLLQKWIGSLMNSKKGSLI